MLAVCRADLPRSRPREVDEVDVLVAHDLVEDVDVREQEVAGFGERVDGLRAERALLGDQLGVEPRLLADLPQGGLVGEFVAVDVPARREPLAQTVVFV